MGKYFVSKRRQSHQSKVLRPKQEDTLCTRILENVNKTMRFKSRVTSTFKPLAASTPYEISQSSHFNTGSSCKNWCQQYSTNYWYIYSHIDPCLKSERLLFTPPTFSSTPKPTRRSTTINPSMNGCSNSSCQQKYLFDCHPALPIISPRRLQFTPNAKTLNRYSNDDSKRLNIQNVKIWLL